MSTHTLPQGPPRDRTEDLKIAWTHSNERELTRTNARTRTRSLACSLTRLCRLLLELGLERLHPFANLPSRAQPLQHTHRLAAMGSMPSNAALMRVLDTELARLAHPVVAVDARHCSPRATTLLFKKSSLSHGFQVRDITDRHALRFRTTTPSWLSRRAPRLQRRRHTQLVDANRRPVANFRPEHNTPPSKDLYTISRGAATTTTSTSSELQLFQIHARSKHMTTELHVEFVDAASGQQCSVGMYGSWLHRTGIVWLQQGALGEPKPVAKLYPPAHNQSRRDEFCLSISANVDAALLVLVCLALHDQENSAEQR